MIKVMSKKLIRKAIDMIKQLSEEEEIEVVDEEEEEEESTDDKKEDEKKEDEKKDDEKKDGEEKKEGDEKKPEEDKYTKFWKSFGKNIKLGVIEDPSNRSKLAKLLRYHSTNDTEKWTSLDEYMSRMKENQDTIYFLPGDSKEAILKSPLLHKFQKNGLEVLILDDPIDEFCMQHLSEYEKRKVKSIAKDDVNPFSDDELLKKKEQKLKEMYKPLTEFFKKRLGKKAEKVQISNKLVDEAAYIFTSQYGYSANMEKINRAQAFANQEKSASYMVAKKTFEINPHHPVIKELLDRVKSSDGNPDEETVEYGDLLFNMAMLNSGFVIEDTTDLNGSVQKLLKLGFGLKKNAKVEEIEIEVTDEDEDDSKDDDDDEEEDKKKDEKPAEAKKEEKPAAEEPVKEKEDL